MNGSQHVLTVLVVAMQSMVTLLEQPITVRLQSYSVNGQLGIGRKLENMKEQMITSIMKTNSNVRDLEEMKHRATVLITNADARLKLDYLDWSIIPNIREFIYKTIIERGQAMFVLNSLYIDEAKNKESEY